MMVQTCDKFDQPGPLARSVNDLVLFDQVVTEDYAPVVAADPRGLRIGVVPQFFIVDEEVEQIMMSAVDRLRAAGVSIVETALPQIMAQALPTAVTIIAYDAPRGLAKYLAEQKTGVDPEVLLSEVGQNTQATFARFPVPAREEYEAVARTQVELRGVLDRFFADQALEALMFPPTPTPAPLQGDRGVVEIRGVQVPIIVARGSNPAVGSVGGLPSLVLPAGITTDGLPVGVEFAGVRGSDRRLLSMGLCLESILGSIAAPSL
jgi:mandelamide amidase